MALYPSGNSWDNAGSAAYKTTVAYTRMGAGTAGYTSSTNPTLNEVFGFLDDAYYEIGGLLEANGYAIAQTDTEVKGVLQSLQGISAAVKVELSRPIHDLTGDENNRFVRLEEARNRLEALITGNGLALLGATVQTARGAYVAATGVSRDRKQLAYADADYVQARFRRGFGQTPGLGGEPLSAEPGVE